MKQILSITLPGVFIYIFYLQWTGETVNSVLECLINISRKKKRKQHINQTNKQTNTLWSIQYIVIDILEVMNFFCQIYLIYVSKIVVPSYEAHWFIHCNPLAWGKDLCIVYWTKVALAQNILFLIFFIFVRPPHFEAWQFLWFEFEMAYFAFNTKKSHQRLEILRHHQSWRPRQISAYYTRWLQC